MHVPCNSHGKDSTVQYGKPHILTILYSYILHIIMFVTDCHFVIDACMDFEKVSWYIL
jgi:hypothetical protein